LFKVCFFKQSFRQNDYDCVKLKVRFCLSGDSQFLEDETTKNFARKVADHYSRRTNQTLEEREASPIIHLKKLNNWVGYSLTSLSVRETCCIMIIQFCSSFSYSYTNRLKVFWSSFMLVLTMLFSTLPVGRFLT